MDTSSLPSSVSRAVQMENTQKGDFAPFLFHIASCQSTWLLGNMGPAITGVIFLGSERAAEGRRMWGKPLSACLADGSWDKVQCFTYCWILNTWFSLILKTEIVYLYDKCIISIQMEANT